MKNYFATSILDHMLNLPNLERIYTLLQQFTTNLKNYFAKTSVSRTIFIEGSTIAATAFFSSPPPSSIISRSPSTWSFPWWPLTTMVCFSFSSCGIPNAKYLNFSYISCKPVRYTGKLLKMKYKNIFSFLETMPLTTLTNT